MPFNAPKHQTKSAVWLVRNYVLYLQSIESPDDSKDRDRLFSLYRNTNEPASWFTGILLAHSGEITWYRDGVEPMYEKELILKVENGIVIDHEVRFNECPF